MLREVKGLHGAVLRAQDGEIGSVDDILFDDELWTARYLVVDTGSWLTGRKVLIAPAALGLLDWDRQALRVNLTRDQVEGSPAAETEKPVSRQWETDYYDYYRLPYYWGGMGMGLGGGLGLTGGMALSGVQLSRAVGDARPPEQEEDERVRDHESARDPGASHLRSAREVTGYGIAARDGHLGHVEDFLFDDETWKIRYLAVDTRDWWPGKKVLLPLDWIGQVSWPERTVTAKVTRDQVQNGPEWNPREPISRAFEEQLARYYDQQRPGPTEAAASRAGAFAGR